MSPVMYQCLCVPVLLTPTSNSNKKYLLIPSFYWSKKHLYTQVYYTFMVHANCKNRSEKVYIYMALYWIYVLNILS